MKNVTLNPAILLPMIKTDQDVCAGCEELSIDGLHAVPHENELNLDENIDSDI